MHISIFVFSLRGIQPDRIWDFILFETLDEHGIKTFGKSIGTLLEGLLFIAGGYHWTLQFEAGQLKVTFFFFYSCSRISTFMIRYI